MDMKTMEKEIVKLKANSEVDADYLADLKSEVVLLKKMFKKLAKSYSDLASEVDDLKEDFDMQNDVNIAAFNDIYETLYPEEGEEVDVDDEEDLGNEDLEEEEKTPIYHRVVVAVKKTEPEKEDEDEKEEDNEDEDLEDGDMEEEESSIDTFTNDILCSLDKLCDILKDKIKKEKK